ncbi:uncharacterized protein LOC127853229 [Dreissena polymorpha]|uniref:C2H2-type domain-containing protein n=1 Tax=Dreissena polymorpha TaxID=45954 RepID=A0A9D4CNJ2_DREPO|nr:uncharacterized protein LOC127853229 [Dreissena polymorpha]XP_052243484.1 uncharacterized protein LOC127853229 [Dreissena polymorpha]XP_052243485.1 uncharacterized protein LOC127853229 [Dreissena polymorpha]KAH3727747.1 hypothetical protein DPMN_053690 [Dreissena polymorpha]
MWRNKSRFHGNPGQHGGHNRSRTTGGHSRDDHDQRSGVYEREAKKRADDISFNEELTPHYDDRGLGHYTAENERAEYHRKHDDYRREDVRHDDYRDSYPREQEADLLKRYPEDGDSYSQRDSGRFDDYDDRRRARYEDQLGLVDIELDIGRDRFKDHGIDIMDEDRLREKSRYDEGLSLTQEEIFHLEERQRLASYNSGGRDYSVRHSERLELEHDRLSEGRSDQKIYNGRHSDNWLDRKPRDMQTRAARRSFGGQSPRKMFGNRGRGYYRGSRATRGTGTFKTPRILVKHAFSNRKAGPVSKSDQRGKNNLSEKESDKKPTNSDHLSSSSSKTWQDSLNQSGAVKKPSDRKSTSLEINKRNSDISVSKIESSTSRYDKLTDKSKSDKRTESRHEPRHHSKDRKSLTKHDESRSRRNSNTGHKKARTSSGHKKDHDYHEEDVLSILADDDGFEKETKRIIGSDSRGCPSPRKLEITKTVSAKTAVEEKTKTDDTQIKAVDKESNSRKPAEHQETPRGQVDNKAVTNTENRLANRSNSYQFHYNAFSQRGRIRSAKTYSFASKFKKRPFQSHIRNRFGYGGHTGRFSEQSHSHGLKSRQTYFDNNQDRINTGLNVSKEDVWNRRSISVAATRRDLRGYDTLISRERSGAILRDDRDEISNDDIKDTKNVYIKGSYALYDKSVDNYHGQTSFVRNKPFHSWQRDGSRYKTRPSVSHNERVKKKYFRGGMRGNQRFFNRDKAKRHGDTEGDSRNFQKQEVERRQREEYHDDERIVMSRDERAEEAAPQQQVFFIPDSDIAGMQPQFVDQFGNMVANSEVSMMNTGDVPIQYLPQVLGSDSQGEQQQIFFIPFNQMQGYPESLNPAPVGVEAQRDMEQPKYQEPKVSSNKKDTRKKLVRKGLSKEARAKIRAKLALKRRKRMEKEIEEKVLNKLLKSSRFSNLNSSSSLPAPKKPVIKRISPPSATKPTHLNKKLTVTRHARQKAEDLENVSDEDKYDNISDLEDVSDENYYDQDDGTVGQNSKRPMFRKPGQQRKNSQSQRKGCAYGDVRKVVDQNSEMNNTKRTVLVEDKKRPDKRHGHYDYEHSRPSEEKRHRSMSPIEITVSNENYVSSSHRSNESPNRKRFGKNVGSLANQKHNQEKDNQHLGYEREGFERFNRSYNGNNGYDDKVGHSSAPRTDSRRATDSNTKDSDRRDSGKYRRDEDAHPKNDPYRSKDESSNIQRNRKDPHSRSHEPSKDREDRRSTRSGRLSNSPRRRSRSPQQQSRDKPQHRRDSAGRNDELWRDRGEKTTNSRSTLDNNALNFSQNAALSHNQYMPNSNCFQSFPNQGQGNMRQGHIDNSFPPHTGSMSGPMHSPFPQSIGHNIDVSVPPQLSTANSGMNQGNFGEQMEMGQGMQTGQQLHPRMPQQSNYLNQQFGSQYQMQQNSLFTPMKQNQMGGQQPNIQSSNLFPMQNQGMQTFQQNRTQMITRGPFSQNVGQLQMAQGQNMGPNVRQEQDNIQPLLPNSIGQSNFIATTPQQAMRGVIGTLATGGVGGQQAVRVLNKGPRPAFMVQGSGKPDHQSEHKRDVTTAFGSDVAASSNQYRDDKKDEDVGQMPCSLCEKVFMNRNAIRKHTAWHDKQATKDEKFKCDSCEQGFPNFQEYSSHIQEKHTVDSLNCNSCDKTFYTVVQYQRHIDLMHLQSMPLHSCSLCPASFAQIRYLVQHKREHHQRKQSNV